MMRELIVSVEVAGMVVHTTLAIDLAVPDEQVEASVRDMAARAHWLVMQGVRQVEQWMAEKDYTSE